MSKDVYQLVTDRIVKQLEKGVVPWQKPYKSFSAKSRQTGKKYSMLNQILLGEWGEYFTFKQASDEGFKIRKGAKSRFVVFWSLFVPGGKGNGDETENGEEVVGNVIPLLRYYNVFHHRDVEGFTCEEEIIEETVKHETAPQFDKAQEVLDAYFKREGIELDIKKAECPSYRPGQDKIIIQDKCFFNTLEGYYCTLFHEAVHSTGSKARLDRDIDGRYGSGRYAQEELVAEIGAAFLLASCGIEFQIENITAYCKTWLQAVSSDKKLIVIAASKAEKACQFILGQVEEN